MDPKWFIIGRGGAQPLSDTSGALSRKDNFVWKTSKLKKQKHKKIDEIEPNHEKRKYQLEKLLCYLDDEVDLINQKTSELQIELKKLICNKSFWIFTLIFLVFLPVIVILIPGMVGGEMNGIELYPMMPK